MEQKIREHSLIIVGAKGSGKTSFVKEVVKKANDKTLIFDTSDEYNEYEVIDVKDIDEFNEQENSSVRRILCKDLKSEDDLIDLLDNSVFKFRNGLVIIESADTLIQNLGVLKSLPSLLFTSRRNIELIIIFQSYKNALLPKIIDSADFLQVRKTLDNVINNSKGLYDSTKELLIDAEKIVNEKSVENPYFSVTVDLNNEKIIEN